MTMIPKPIYYTYLIKCLPTNEYYYGVRYSKQANPNELWKTYFTSSKRIKERIKLYGISQFEYEIRRTFECPYKARLWECRVLKKLNAVERTNFLNQHDALCFEHRKEFRCWERKLMFLVSENRYTWIDRDLVKYYIDNNLGIFKKRPRTENCKKAISEKLKMKKRTEEHEAKLAEARSKRKGIKLPTLEERFGPEKANKIKEQINQKRKETYNKHGHPLKGKTYEELYGHQKAEEIIAKRSAFFKKNNPSHQNKGKTYEEIYGLERAENLKKVRRKGNSANEKKYNIFKNNKLIFTGKRLEAIEFLVTYLKRKSQNPNIIYDTLAHKKQNLTVEILRKLR